MTRAQDTNQDTNQGTNQDTNQGTNQDTNMARETEHTQRETPPHAADTTGPAADARHHIVPAASLTWLPACVAEGIGTFGLVFAGCGAIMIDALSRGQVTHVGVGLVFGLIIAAMVYAIGHISGAHLNPAVTLGFVLARHFPVRRLVGYWLAQVVGAVAAAACLRLLLGSVAHLGATLPSGSGGAWQSFWLEALLTFFLMFVIMAVATDTRAVGQAAALAIGATVGLEALFAGPISGASMNPARSLGPALVGGTWTALWVYLLAPPLGAAAAALLYRWLRTASTDADGHREDAEGAILGQETIRGDDTP